MKISFDKKSLEILRKKVKKLIKVLKYPLFALDNGKKLFKLF